MAENGTVRAAHSLTGAELARLGALVLELGPSEVARRYGLHHQTIVRAMAGQALMPATLRDIRRQLAEAESDEPKGAA